MIIIFAGFNTYKTNTHKTMRFIKFIVPVIFLVVFAACDDELPAPEDQSSDKQNSTFNETNAEQIAIQEPEDSTETTDTTETDTIENCGYRTQTIGGWGTAPAGNNPGAYLYEHFAETFPDGLEAGCDLTLTFTSAQAITEFLPDGGTASVLNESHTNPSTLNNVFASQVVALTLSLAFDEQDPGFSASNGSLGEREIREGEFAGMRVAEVLTIAHDALGGCETGYTINELNTVITHINENFVDGEQNHGFLKCNGNDTEENQ